MTTMENTLRRSHARVNERIDSILYAVIRVYLTTGQRLTSICDVSVCNVLSAFHCASSGLDSILLDPKPVCNLDDNMGDELEPYTVH